MAVNHWVRGSSPCWGAKPLRGHLFNIVWGKRVDFDDYAVIFYADFLDEPLKEGHFFGRKTCFTYVAEIL